jgi:excisionase family DNA binding protein
VIEQHYSSATLAALLDCSTETLRRAAIAGELRSVRLGADRRYSESAVNEWLRQGGDLQIERGQLVQLDRRRVRVHDARMGGLQV